MMVVFRYNKVVIGILLLLTLGLVLLAAPTVSALNILEYKDVISDSGPGQPANHTIGFVLNTSLSADSAIEITPPFGFSVLATTTFAERNVELWVDGVARVSASTATPGVDKVEITTGSPGFFRYTLAPDYAITTGSHLEFRIGNHTSTALQPVTSYSTSTGTTTSTGDTEPVVNSATLGKHDVNIEIYDGILVANAKAVVFLVEKVNLPNVDTRETIPPFRFNGSPTSTVGGTTLNVEISLETDEFAVCRYSTTSEVVYGSMPNLFSNTGLLFHSQVVTVTPSSLNQFYIRCIDDEGNFNIDDYVISFTVNDVPAGTANTDGTTDGDGTGSGDNGTGTGSGNGGTSGSSDGEQPLEGGDSGSGGSGGGGGGGSGGSTGDTAGGGFESQDAPYRSGDGKVIISGHAYPNSTVGILVDGNFFSTTGANSVGQYSITLDEIARGVYTFGIYAEDLDDVRSSTFSTSFTVTGSRTSALTNINVAPSITVSPDPISPGETLTVSGFALPNSNITIENVRNNSPSVKELSAVSDSYGRWTTTINTTSFSVDTYQIRAKAEQTAGETTRFSEYTFYGVGQEAEVQINADLNRDGKVNLIDFSILLFWWNTSGGDSSPPADINSDGKVSLTDFSILLFNWTG